MGDSTPLRGLDPLEAWAILLWGCERDVDGMWTEYLEIEWLGNTNSPPHVTGNSQSRWDEKGSVT